MKRYSNCSISGIYHVYQNGKLISSNKNKLTELFLDYLADIGDLKPDYSIDENRPTYNWPKLASIIDSEYALPKLGISNQINLTITENNDNFAFSELINYDSTLSKNILKELKLNAIELLSENGKQIIRFNSGYLLPKKNLGNITGFGIYGVDINASLDNYNNYQFSLLSLTQVRDNSGYKGTVSHTETDNTYIVYSIDYVLDLDASISVINVDFVDGNKPYSFIRYFIDYNWFHKQNKSSYSSNYSLYKGDTKEFLVNDVKFSLEPELLDAVNLYGTTASENVVDEITYRNVSFQEVNLINRTQNSVEIKTDYYFNYFNIHDIFKGFIILNDIDKYDFILNSEGPWELKFINGLFCESIGSNIDKFGFKKIRLSFIKKFVINEYEVYDE